MGVDDFRKRADNLFLEAERLEDAATKMGGKGAASTMTCYAEIRGLIADLRELESREREIENSDIATKLKFSRKAKKAGKGFWRIVREINALHAKGEMEEKDAKQFGKVLELIKVKKLLEAERELFPFKRLEALAKEREKIHSEIDVLTEEIESRISYLRNELTSVIPKEKIEELAKGRERYQWATEIVKGYDEWRVEQVEKLMRLPVAKLIKACASNDDLFGLGFPKPRDMLSLEEFGDFLVSSKINGDAKEVLGLRDLEPEELRGIVADHHQFRRLASENSRWLEAVAELRSSDFLRFDFGNDERKRKLLLALGLAKEKNLEERVGALAQVGRKEFEEWKAASMTLEGRLSAQKNIDERSINSELSELERIRGELPLGTED